MTPNHEAKPASSDARAYVQTVISMLEKALGTVQGQCTDADIRIAAGKVASATRTLRRACEALNTCPARAVGNTTGRA